MLIIGYWSCRNLIYPIKQNGVSSKQYGCTIWTQTKCTEKKSDENYTRMLRYVLKKILKATPHKIAAARPLSTHFKKHTSKRNKTCWTLWWSKHELISDVLLWTLTYGHTSVARPAKTYRNPLCTDTRYSQEDVRWTIATDGERERERGVSALSETWWWWWWLSPEGCFDFK